MHGVAGQCCQTPYAWWGMLDSPPVCVQWESTENKTSVVLYGVGALVVVWLTSTIVGAVNNVPLVRMMI